ncbi:probable calcium-binding protein CML48 isoform X1 [Malus sylvestris]|uniref:probable calcium-binding protein CML48 isoform X1 n=1 Tax=Malus sylvestris TaxID=3752 RepID=UPI0021ACE17E|nr:probable calcium-binding protein CML48 isoform X1 [Malus sylvestris]XP_050138193.1 probable calcium-binding protein CML48 isoform X1 [Malus sylvestris]
MASNGKYGSHPYAPSAPSLPDSYGPQHSQYSHGYGQPQPQPQPQGWSSSFSSYGQSGFPAGTDPAVIRSFEMVDRDRSGYIDENELQQALSSGYQRFSLRTILLIFLFKSPTDSLRVGPKEFAALWTCLGQWRSIFERYDKDGSGKIDSMELRDALYYGLGLAMPPSVLQLLISKYDDGSGRRVELNFDSFAQCGMIVRGLTDRFKEKDRRYTGSANFGYDEFMSMVIPFLVSYN